MIFWFNFFIDFTFVVAASVTATTAITPIDYNILLLLLYVKYFGNDEVCVQSHHLNYRVALSFFIPRLRNNTEPQITGNSQSSVHCNRGVIEQ